MEIRPMRAGEREPVLDLLEHAFAERALFEAYMDFDPLYRCDDFLLALEGDRPVCCVQIFEKTIRLRGRALRMGGIGSVATHADYRRRGLAEDLMRRSEQRMRERGLPLALLFGVWGGYARLGWVRIPARQLALHGEAARADLQEGVSVRPFTEDDLPRVQALYEAYSAHFDGTTVRDEDYWRGQLRYAGAPGEDFRVAVTGDVLVAYARRVGLGASLAMEFAHAPGQADTLASVLLQQCPREGALILRLPPGTDLERALARRADGLDRVDDSSFMWRVLDPETLCALADLPATAPDPEVLEALIARPPAHYWASDRF
jgi:predicted N-acetyltransferase YhbS